MNDKKKLLKQYDEVQKIWAECLYSNSPFLCELAMECSKELSRLTQELEQEA